MRKRAKRIRQTVGAAEVIAVVLALLLGFAPLAFSQAEAVDGQAVDVTGETEAAEDAEDVVVEEVGEARDINEMLEDDSFRYDSAGRRDPFRSLLELKEKGGDEEDDKPKPPIQQIDLKQIVISGVIEDEVAGNRAVIKAGGRTFVVKKGMIIGKNEGEVVEVSLEGIRVMEKFEDFMRKETLKEEFIKARREPTTGN